MKLRHYTLALFILIVLTCAVARACAQEYKALKEGFIVITKEWIFIRDDEDTIDYDLFILQCDTVKTAVYFAVISDNGPGYMWFTDYSAYLQTRADKGRRSRLKKYYLVKQ